MFKNLLIPLGTLILAIALIGATGYVYHRESINNRQNDNLISSVQDQFRQRTAEEERLAQLAQAKASLEAAITRLAQLRAALSPVAAIADAYDTIKKQSAKLSMNLTNISGPRAQEIANASKQLADTLQAWQILISNIPSSGPSSSQTSEAEQYAREAQIYVNQIQTAVDNLNSSDSGLTQDQITVVQTTAATAADTVNQTTNDLTIALPVTDTSSSTSSGTSTDVTAADVAAQQQVVDQLQNQITQLQQQQSQGGTASQGPVQIIPYYQQDNSGYVVPSDGTVPSQVSGPYDEEDPPILIEQGMGTR